tara:strand:+ start:139151 stop:140803 length:1653 start_codon:yes stop_codon:yes gene_type:complete
MLGRFGTVVINRLAGWADSTFVDLGRQFRWSYLPPLMVYLAAGMSGLTAIVAAFFVKDYFGFSAAFLAGLSFWAGIPWILKMPLGHLVDIIWRWKSSLIYLGAALIACSIAIMFGLVTQTAFMAAIMRVEAWYVLSVLLAPVGYVIQDVVADAMTVEAVPLFDRNGAPYGDDVIKAMHTTMQTLGRFAIISGIVIVAALNIGKFSGVAQLTNAEKIPLYGELYLIAFALPVISVAGVISGNLAKRRRVAAMRAAGLADDRIERMTGTPAGETTPNWWIFGGSLAFVAFALAMGLSDIAFSQEIIFVGSMAIILVIMSRLIREIDAGTRGALIGTALIVFAFRAVPLPGPGATWWEIDVLRFDEQFLSILTLITSILALIGMIVLRPLMAKHSIAYVVVLLTVVGGLLSLPNIGLYYGVHNWTSEFTSGVVDARFIAIFDTALESPLSQIAMIPMLAWIAKNAPPHLKATFFAVMASFTNLALSASSLATKYLNQVYVIQREVLDRATGVIDVVANYSELGWLLISVALIALLVPLLTVALVQRSRFRTTQ